MESGFYLLLVLVIRWGVSQVQAFFLKLKMSHFDWSIWKKQIPFWRPPNTKMTILMKADKSS
jgi:hypothetical protein